MSEEQQYINFDEYIRQGEPSKREAAYAWSTAIGLQAVDGLKTSEYLNDLARVGACQLQEHCKRS